ncbi:MAG: Crp/Fnr family transcriptional regulator [Bacteroidia bacterium]
MRQLISYLHSLSPISTETRAAVERIFTPGILTKGDFFIREGDKVTDIGFLNEGVIRAFYRTSEGTEYNKHFFTSPCFIGGYSSLITGKTNIINQQALTNCVIETADYSKLTALYNNHPDLERAARHLAELFFTYKEEREIEIVLLNADKRYELFRKQYPTLEQLIPQYHIASYLGITPTQLSRIRRNFGRN